MYYLRKENRAIYQYKEFSNFYINGTYPDCENKIFKLYEVKNIRDIMKLRKKVYDDYGEWFDVYDENKKINLIGESK